MGSFIKQTEYKKSVRAVQILAYITLIGTLADIVLFVAYSLKPDSEKDSFDFFVTILMSILGVALYSAVGISLPNNGKFSYYKISVHAFLISDVIGVVNGLRILTSKDTSDPQKFSMYFYTAFFLGCLISNILVLRFFVGKTSRKPALFGSIFMILLILLHMGDLIYSLAVKDSFVNYLPEKRNLIRLVSNSAFLIAAVGCLLIICIKPQENNGSQ